MNEHYKDAIKEFLWMVICGLYGVSLYITFLDPYKQGQIDCANGKLQYEIRKQADGSMTLERKEK